MGKEEKERKPRKVRDIESEYLKWPWVDYKFQYAHKFNITNPLLIKEQKKQLEKLYWKTYGIGHITNNELYSWMIKGWIAENKCNVVNWVEVAISIAQEKAQCVSSSFIPRTLGEKSNYNDGSKLPSNLGMSV